MNPDLRNIVACALIDKDGYVLIAQRPAGKPKAGFWEFPGGKIHENETPENALIRELDEELGIDVQESCLAPFTFTSYRDSPQHTHLIILLYICRVWKGQPFPREGQKLVWAYPHKMREYNLLPTNAPLVAMLRDFL